MKIIYNLYNIRVVYTLKMKHVTMCIIFLYLGNTGVVTMSFTDRWKPFIGVGWYGVIKPDVICHRRKKNALNISQISWVSVIILSPSWRVISLQWKAVLIGNERSDCRPKLLFLGIANAFLMNETRTFAIKLAKLEIWHYRKSLDCYQLECSKQIWRPDLWKWTQELLKCENWWMGHYYVEI